MIRPSGERASRFTRPSGPRSVLRRRERCRVEEGAGRGGVAVRIDSPPFRPGEAVTPAGWRISSRRASPASGAHVPEAQVRVERAGGEVARRAESRVPTDSSWRRRTGTSSAFAMSHRCTTPSTCAEARSEPSARRPGRGRRVVAGAAGAGRSAARWPGCASAGPRGGWRRRPRHRQEVGDRGEHRLLGGGRLAEGADLPEGARPPCAERRVSTGLGGTGRAGRVASGAAGGPGGRAPGCVSPFRARHRGRRLAHGGRGAQPLLDHPDERDDAGARVVQRLRALRGLEGPVRSSSVRRRRASRSWPRRRACAPRGRAAPRAGGSPRSRRGAPSPSRRGPRSRATGPCRGRASHRGEGLRQVQGLRVEGRRGLAHDPVDETRDGCQGGGCI